MYTKGQVTGPSLVSPLAKLLCSQLRYGKDKLQPRSKSFGSTGSMECALEERMKWSVSEQTNVYIYIYVYACMYILHLHTKLYYDTLCSILSTYVCTLHDIQRMISCSTYDIAMISKDEYIYLMIK